jgi:hypothetical protein
MQIQTTPIVAVQDWGESLRASLAGALAMLLAAIPRILAFVVILLVGWLIASLLAKAVATVLRSIRFNDLAQRAGFAGFVQGMGVRRDSAGVIADLAKWFVRLIALVVAFDALGLPAVSDVLRQLLLWLPNLVVALVVLVVGGLLAEALGNLVRGATATAGFSNPDTLARVAQVAIWAFAIVVAVNQIGIASNLINILLIGVVGALALAAGLAFGLGGRDKAAQVIDSWKRGAGAERPSLSRVTNIAADKVRRVAEGGWRGQERRRLDRRAVANGWRGRERRRADRRAIGDSPS